MADVDVFWIARNDDASVIHVGVTDPGLVTVSGQPVFEQDEDAEKHIEKLTPFIDKLESDDDVDEDGEPTGTPEENESTTYWVCRVGRKIVMRRNDEEIEIDADSKTIERRKIETEKVEETVREIVGGGGSRLVGGTPSLAPLTRQRFRRREQ